jgi:hypothetical protein
MNKLPVLDQWVAVLNLCCVVVSVVVNWWAARSGLFRFRTAHAAIAAVSAMYVVLYLWLLGWLSPIGLSAPLVPVWSSVGRGISLVAWIVVWICPACMSIRATRELHAAIRDRQDGGT